MGGGSGPTAGATKTEALDPPGVAGPSRSAVAASAGPTRLVFDVPADTRLPFSVAGLLDWSGLDLRVGSLAAIPPEPTAEQIAAAPVIAPPSGECSGATASREFSARNDPGGLAPRARLD